MLQARPQIIVVDDEEAMRILLKDFLTSQGYSVSCFASAFQALKSMKEGSVSTTNTAIVADVKMAPIDGIAMTQEVVQSYPTIPVFLFTGVGGPAEKQEALRSGAQGYLMKPFSLSELKRILDQKFPTTRK